MEHTLFKKFVRLPLAEALIILEMMLIWLYPHIMENLSPGLLHNISVCLLAELILSFFAILLGLNILFIKKGRLMGKLVFTPFSLIFIIFWSGVIVKLGVYVQAFIFILLFISRVVRTEELDLTRRVSVQVWGSFVKIFILFLIMILCSLLDGFIPPLGLRHFNQLLQESSIPLQNLLFGTSLYFLIAPCVERLLLEYFKKSDSSSMFVLDPP
ncbi:MAG: hypothetical protein Q7R35_15790 [Elusimicrobiota bacterium]|nr:hypothetical protein [Elusimicrobiota bacterium]